MMRQSKVLQFVCIAAVFAVFAGMFISEPARGQGLQYQDADELTVNPALGRPNVAPVSAFNSALPVVDTDNLWQYRDFGVGPPTLPTVYQSGISEDSPLVTQTLTGLVANQSYDLYAVYWTDEDENWTIRTGTNPGNLTFYSWSGNSGVSTTPGSTKGVTAASAPWIVRPPTTKDPSGSIFTERPLDPLVMVLGYAGTASANAQGQLDVHIDDNANGGGPRRTWFDGIAYANAGTPITTSATIDRNTGNLTLTNSTPQSLEIKSYRIGTQNGEAANAASGELNGANWTKISTGNPNWTITDPIPPADPNAPFQTTLGETGNGTTITVAGNGGTLNFGNVWNKSPFEQILVYLTLADDTLAVLAPAYTGQAIANGDLDANGSVNLADFQTFLNNLHSTPASTLTRVERYRLGELTNDAVINISDWIAFRAAYDAANGAGAFEIMLTQVPEPGTLALLALAGVVAPLFARRRAASFVMACVICAVLGSASSAATLLKVDVNDREGDFVAGPPGDNTVAGFSPYVLTGTTAAVPNSSGVVDGYTITMTAVNAAGTATGAIDDRDRGAPTTAPTLNQLYDDFIFAGTSVGAGGGIDVMISGGALMPNTQYGISLYSFDSGSTAAPQPRTANWLDGNSSNAVVFGTSFSGGTSPTTDDQYKRNGVFRTDGSGALFLRGRNTLPGADPAVFINGIEITDELPAQPVELTLRVNTTTGAVSIVNQQTVPIDMSYYEIRSNAGSLNPGGWTSLDDAEGGDPVGTGWDEAPLSNSNILSEVNLQGLRTFTPGSSVSLGNAFSVGGATDLQMTYLAGPGGVSGDYSGNGTVDAADYVVWRKNVNTSTTLPNDTTPGTVTQDDYTVWRANFGRTGTFGAVPRVANISFVTAGGGAVAAVPEPGIGALLIVALGALSAGRRPRASGN